MSSMQGSLFPPGRWSLAATLAVAGLFGCPDEPGLGLAGGGPGSGGAITAPPDVQVPAPLPVGSPKAFSSRSLVLSEPVPAGKVVDAQAGPASAPLQLASEAPLSLTSSEGTGLRLLALKASAVVEEPLAFTELQLAFENPQDRTVEGTFKITLPQGATISRFAMKLGDRWQEGEVLEKQAARVAYEDFLHRRQDPALLEQQAGNEFSARVFPIPARGVKELILSYSQELAKDEQPYRIPLLGLPELGTLDIRVLLAKGGDTGQGGSSLGGSLQTNQVIEVNRQRWTPDRDFEVPQAHTADRLGLRHENLVVARITPILEAQPDEISSLFILVDSSASRALGFTRQLELVQRIAAGLRDGAGPATPLAVACFDQVVAPIFDGQAGDFGAEQLRQMAQRQALGASDLEGALSWLATELAKRGRHQRVLLVSDGVATAGEVGGDRLRAAVQKLAQGKVERLDVLAVGGIRDDELLGRLVTAGLPRDGAVVDGAAPLAEIGRRLTQATRSQVQVTVDGAAWVWPNVLRGVQAGDQVLVYADLPATQPFGIALDGVPLAADRRQLAKAERPLLERAWVKARISRVLEQRDTVAANDPDLREGLRRQVIELSTRYRVLSPYTALLVLETEQDYRRFGIDRNALADILTVGATGLTVINRSAGATALAGQPLLPPTTTRTPGPPPGAKSAPAPGGPSRARASRDDDGNAQAREGESEEKAKGVVDDRMPADRRARAAEAAGTGTLQALAGRGEGGGGMGMGRGFGDMPAAAARREAPADQTAEADKKDEAAPRPEATAPGPPAAPAPAREPAPMAAAAPAEPMADAPSGGALRPLPAPAAPAPSAAPRLQERTVAEGRAGIRGADGDRGVLQLVRPSPPLATTPAQADPYAGPFKEVMAALRRGDRKGALARAQSWLQQSPGDVMALVALGEAEESLGETSQAARAYGSLIDLFPSRADLRRFAGERLERLAGGAGLALATDTYRKAVEQRPDHPASHRLYAFTLLRAGRAAEAVQVLLGALRRTYPAGRFAGVDRILREDLALAAAAWIAQAPDQRDLALGMLREFGVAPEERPSLRFVLNWETDANDVDFHIHDGRGGHAYYQAMHLPSGGELYADVTTGYGPECFTIRSEPNRRAYPYRLQAHYYSRGPMGYGMGLLQVIEHDGRGGLRLQSRPFVVMQDQAFVELGSVPGPLKG